MKRLGAVSGKFLGLILLSLLAPGCARLTIRSADCMYQSNPTKTVAVFGSGMVVWPGIGKNEAKLGLTENRQALAAMMPQTENVLKAKGYDVVTCQSAGIGYYNPILSTRAVLETPDPKYNKLVTPREWQEKNRDPIYLYELSVADPEFRMAVDTVFADMEAAIGRGTLYTYSPPANCIATIRRYVKADTILFNRVWGQEYTTSRKVGAFFSELGIAMLGGSAQNTPHESIESHCLFVGGPKNEVLWQRGVTLSGDPAEPPPKAMELMLQLFPRKGELMDPRYKPVSRRSL